MKPGRIKQRVVDRIAPRLARRLQGRAREEGIDMQVRAEPASTNGQARLVLSGPDLQRHETGDWHNPATGTISRLVGELNFKEGKSS